MTTAKRNSLPLILAGMVTLASAMPASAAPGDDPTHQSMMQSEPMAGQPDQAPAAAFEYLSIAGSAFHPFDSSTSYTYPGNGCISKTGGPDARFTHKVVLPQGVVVRYLRLYYFDTSASSVTAFFTTYDGTGAFVDRSAVSSVNAAGGYASALSSPMSYEADHFSEAISIVANLGTQNDDTLRFCGVRIAYDAPITDRIFANGFERAL